MTEDILNLIVHLENSLGNFYGKLQALSRYSVIKPVLTYMEEHSYAHGNLIEQTNKELQKPQMRKELIVNFQEKLTKKIYEKVQTEDDIRKTLKILAGSEEALGNLYLSIADYLHNLSEYYEDISARVKKIGEEEFQHRDLLLMEKKNSDTE